MSQIAPYSLHTALLLTTAQWVLKSSALYGEYGAIWDVSCCVPSDVWLQQAALTLLGFSSGGDLLLSVSMGTLPVWHFLCVSGTDRHTAV